MIMNEVTCFTLQTPSSTWIKESKTWLQMLEILDIFFFGCSENVSLTSYSIPLIEVIYKLKLKMKYRLYWISQWSKIPGAGP